MGLFKNLFQRGAVIAEGAKMISQNGVPQVPTNPEDAINAAFIVQRDVGTAKFVAGNAVSAVQDIQASTNPSPSATPPSAGPAEQSPEATTTAPIEPLEQPTAQETPPPTSTPVQ